MINYRQLKEKLNVTDYHLSRFTEIVDLAVSQRSKAYMPTLAMFASKGDVEQAYVDAEGDVRDMSWKEIYDLCCDLQVGVEMTIDKQKAEDKDPFLKAGRTGTEEGR
tara:strand:+ start:513 stop:833 length:321 start_codon:yes stop_codon:yes gene_type:complete